MSFMLVYKRHLKIKILIFTLIFILNNPENRESVKITLLLFTKWFVIQTEKSKNSLKKLLNVILVLNSVGFSCLKFLPCHD